MSLEKTCPTRSGLSLAGVGTERGFTLLETLVALALLGIVLTTLFRLAGDTLVQYGSREAQLRLALTAEAAFNAERVQPGLAVETNWPEDIQVTVERRDFGGMATTLEGLEGLADTLARDLQWLSVLAVDGAGRRAALEGAVARPQP